MKSLMSSCFALACRYLRITDEILSISDSIIRVSSSERMKYKRKSGQHFSAFFCTERRLIFVAFDFRGIHFCFNQSFLFVVNMIVVFDFDIIIHANSYTKLFKSYQPDCSSLVGSRGWTFDSRFVHANPQPLALRLSQSWSSNFEWSPRQYCSSSQLQTK